MFALIFSMQYIPFGEEKKKHNMETKMQKVRICISEDLDDFRLQCGGG